MNKADHLRQLELLFWCARLSAGSVADGGAVVEGALLCCLPDKLMATEMVPQSSLCSWCLHCLEKVWWGQVATIHPEGSHWALRCPTYLCPARPWCPVP